MLLHALPETTGKAQLGICRRVGEGDSSLTPPHSMLSVTEPSYTNTTASPRKVPGFAAWSVSAYQLHFPEGWSASQVLAQEATQHPAHPAS